MLYIYTHTYFFMNGYVLFFNKIAILFDISVYNVFPKILMLLIHLFSN